MIGWGFFLNSNDKRYMYVCMIIIYIVFVFLVVLYVIMLWMKREYIFNCGMNFDYLYMYKIYGFVCG